MRAAYARRHAAARRCRGSAQLPIRRYEHTARQKEAPRQHVFPRPDEEQPFAAIDCVSPFYTAIPAPANRAPVYHYRQPVEDAKFAAKMRGACFAPPRRSIFLQPVRRPREAKACSVIRACAPMPPRGKRRAAPMRQRSSAHALQFDYITPTRPPLHFRHRHHAFIISAAFLLLDTPSYLPVFFSFRGAASFFFFRHHAEARQLALRRYLLDACRAAIALAHGFPHILENRFSSSLVALISSSMFSRIEISARCHAALSFPAEMMLRHDCYQQCRCAWCAGVSFFPRLLLPLPPPSSVGSMPLAPICFAAVDAKDSGI